MIQALIGPIASLAGSWMESKVEQTKAKGAVAKAKAEAVVTLNQVETLNGTYPVTVTDGVVSIGGATVLATDLVAGNGVVHLIDTVILPE